AARRDAGGRDATPCSRPCRRATGARAAPAPLACLTPRVALGSLIEPMAKRPAHDGIIVMGAPRSGTTLLRRILDAHPDIACPGETNLLAACARFLHSETIAEGVDIGVLAGLEFAGFAEDAVLEALREFAFGFHREYAKRQGKPRWACKTAFDVFYWD